MGRLAAGEHRPCHLHEMVHAFGFVRVEMAMHEGARVILRLVVEALRACALEGEEKLLGKSCSHRVADVILSAARFGRDNEVRSRRSPARQWRELCSQSNQGLKAQGFPVSDHTLDARYVLYVPCQYPRGGYEPFALLGEGLRLPGLFLIVLTLRSPRHLLRAQSAYLV